MKIYLIYNWSHLLCLLQGAKVIAGPQSKFFIPQKMYLSEGCSLRGQITYPKKTEGPDPNEDEFILLLLTDLGNKGPSFGPYYNW